MTCYNLKSLGTVTIFLSEFLRQNVLILTSPKIPQGAKCHNIPKSKNVQVVLMCPSNILIPPNCILFISILFDS